MVYYESNYICHHGIKGQKWGVRRWQNADGSLTPEGIKRYGEHGADYLSAKKAYKKASREAGIARRAVNIAGKNPYSNVVTNVAAHVAKAHYENKERSAKDNFTRAKFTRDYETGRRKKLNGHVQPDVEDEVKYGRRESVRIAKRQNKGMTRQKAEQITKNKRLAKAIGKVAVAGLGAYNSLSGGKVTKAAFKGGVKAAATVAKGVRAAKKMYNNYYNMQVLDSSGKVLARFHDTAFRGENIVANLLSA